MTTNEFIQQHRNDDVRKLAFMKDRFPDVDMPFALDQIEGWQRARTKLPEWASNEQIIFPPHISMEQCSSEHTALYKAGLTHVSSDNEGNTTAKGFNTLIDLTGGFGVDFSYMARNFEHAIYVEQQPHLCEIAKHNFEILGLKQAEVVNADGVEFLRSIQSTDAVVEQNINTVEPRNNDELEQNSNSVAKLKLINKPYLGRTFIYLDPARRDSHGAKVYGIEDCTPNVLEIYPELLAKADRVMIKLSPMLDLHAAIKCLPVSEVHIVSVGNECKELLLVLQKGSNDSVRIVCVNDDAVFEYNYGEKTDVVSSLSAINQQPAAGNYLYEPNASIMKAGCFDELSASFSAQALSRNSHLFVSTDEIADFPGRKFIIQAISSMNKKELRQALAGISQANIAVRNFPLSVAELRKRLKLKDGGDIYIFATTIGEREHTLIICKKVS